MAEVTDPNGTAWSVHLHWRPWEISQPLDPAGRCSSHAGTQGIAGGARRVRRRWMPLLDRLALLAPGELCGAPWKVVVTRDGEDVAEEKIEGWRA